MCPHGPTTDRFLSRDPLGRAPLFFADNPYVYAGNNPLSNVDPSGQYRAAGFGSTQRESARATNRHMAQVARMEHSWGCDAQCKAGWARAEQQKRQQMISAIHAYLFGKIHAWYDLGITMGSLVIELLLFLAVAWMAFEEPSLWLSAISDFLSVIGYMVHAGVDIAVLAGNKSILPSETALDQILAVLQIAANAVSIFGDFAFGLASLMTEAQNMLKGVVVKLILPIAVSGAWIALAALGIGTDQSNLQWESQLASLNGDSDAQLSALCAQYRLGC